MSRRTTSCPTFPETVIHRFLLGPRDAAGNDEECAEQWAMRDEAHRDLGWRRGHTAKPVCPSESPSPKEVVRDSIDIARYDAQRRPSER
jgi:hypothetical protein